MFQLSPGYRKAPTVPTLPQPSSCTNLLAIAEPSLLLTLLYLPQAFLTTWLIVVLVFSTYRIRNFWPT